MPESQRPTPYSRFVAKQTPLTADMLNQAIDHANATRSVTGGRGILVRRVASGWIIELARAAQAGLAGDAVKATLMQVVTIENDYLTCQIVADGTASGASLYIAKPFQLRHDAAYYDGVTTWTTIDAQTADESDGATTERWATNLVYFVGCKLYAYQPTGGTGLTISGLVGYEEPLVVDWLDLNIDGRKWGVVE